MKFTDEEWLALSRLLDEVLALPPDARHAWLESLAPAAANLKSTLRELLAQHGGAETNDLLKTLPKLDRAFAGTPDISGALPGAIVGPYRLLRELGHGGMGSVWLAERTDGVLKRPVALKLPHQGVHGVQLAQRFARERDILAALTHPHIARLYDAGVADNGQPFLALEYVDGQPLGAYCDAHRLDLPKRLALFLQVLDAVQYAHAHLVVHRDIKPSNVLVTPEGEVRLLDFGIAKLIAEEAAPESDLTQAAGPLVTPDYASPEQISGAPLTTATDIYSLGVMLYELLTGERPYRLKRDSRGALEEAILEAEIARPSAVCKDPAEAESRGLPLAKLQTALRGDLDTIVLAALKKNPAERYQSVTTFADDLQRYLAHEPVRARPDSLAYRGAKFLRRNRLAVSMSGGALVVLIAGLVGTITQAERATRQVVIAQEERGRADLETRKAREQRDFALRELSRAEAVNDFNAFLLSDAAPAGKPFTAGDLLSRAEAIVERQHAESDANRAEMFVAIGRQYQFMERDAEARRLLGRAYDIARALPDRTTRGRAACAFASALGLAGAREHAETTLWREGMAELPDEPQFASDRISCLLAGSQVARDADDPAEGVARAREAETLLPRLQYPSTFLEMRVRMDLAESYRWAGEYSEAIATFELAYSDLVKLGRENTENAGTLYSNWANALESAGQPLKAEELYRRAVRIGSDEKGDSNVRPMLLTNLAYLLIDLERVAEAARLTDRALARARAAGDDSVVRETLLVRERALRKLGDRARAEELLNDAEQRYRRAYPPGCVCFATFAFERAELALARGDTAGAMAWAGKGMEIVEASSVHRDAVPHFLLHRAELELKLDRFDPALADAKMALQYYLSVVAPGSPSSYVGRAYLAQGRALQALGQPGEARRAISSAVEELRPSLGQDHPLTTLAERLLPGTGTSAAATR